MAAARPRATKQLGRDCVPAASLTPKNTLRTHSGCATPRDDPASDTPPQQQQPEIRPGRILKVDLSGCKYELFRHVASRLCWQLVPAGSTDWDLCWLDTSVSQERLLKLDPTQRVNHFYGMLELARKRPMARTVGALATAAATAAAGNTVTASGPSTAGPAAVASSSGPVASLLLDFMPQTWLLPQQLPAFLPAAQAAGRKSTYIVKPDAGCQGRGIRLVMGGPEAHMMQSLGGPAAIDATPAVAQQYITNPLLVNGLKFDLRIYCLVTSVEPLRVFLHKEGLVRFCTTPYKRPSSKNLACSYMHLTNYGVNKLNTAAFVAPSTAAPGSSTSAAGSNAWRSTSTLPCRGCSSSSDGSDGIWGQESGSAGHQSCAGDASKWSFQQLRQYLELQGADWSLLWSRISQLVTKSLIAVTPHLAASYKATVLNTPTIPKPAPSAHSSHTSLQAAGAITSPAVASSGHTWGLQRCSSSSDGAAGGDSGGQGRSRKHKGLSPAAVAAACGSRCFELLGFDVLIDAELKPWLVEVNHSPSFNIDSPLDRAIKEAVIVDTVRLVRLDPKAIAAAKRRAHKVTQARLLTSTVCRQGCVAGSNACSSGSNDGCSVAVQLETQQAERASLLASIDAWQAKHLGGFERAYPLATPGMPADACSSTNGSCFRHSTSRGDSRGAQLAQQQHEHWLQYAAKQQELYDQLLTLSGSVYRQQQQQLQTQHSPLKQRLLASPTKHQQQQQQQQQAPGWGLRKCTSQATHPPQQHCLQKSSTSPARLQARQTHSSGKLQVSHDSSPAAPKEQQQQQQQQQPGQTTHQESAATGSSNIHSNSSSGSTSSQPVTGPTTGAASAVLHADVAGSRPSSAHTADGALAALRAVLAATQDWKGHGAFAGSSSSSTVRSTCAGSSRQVLRSSRPSSSSGSRAGSRGKTPKPGSSSSNRHGCFDCQTSQAHKLQAQCTLPAGSCSSRSHCSCATGMSSNSSSACGTGRSGSCSTTSSGSAASSTVSTPSSHGTSSSDVRHVSSNFTSAGGTSSRGCCNSSSHTKGCCGPMYAHVGAACKASHQPASLQLGRQLQHSSTWPHSPAHIRSGVNTSSSGSSGSQSTSSTAVPCYSGDDGGGCCKHTVVAVDSNLGNRLTGNVARAGSVTVGGQAVVVNQQLQLAGAAVSPKQQTQHQWWCAQQRMDPLALANQEPSQAGTIDAGSTAGGIKGSSEVQGQFLPQLAQSARLLQRVNTTGGLLGKLDLGRVLGGEGQAAAVVDGK